MPSLPASGHRPVDEETPEVVLELESCAIEPLERGRKPAPAPAPVPVAIASRPEPQKKRKRKRLGEQLIEAGLIDQHKLAQALAHQRVHGGRLGQILVQLGMIDETTLESQLGQQLGLTVREVDTIDPPPDVLRVLSEEDIRRYEVIPLRRERGRLIVGMVDPLNLALRAQIQSVTGGLRLRVEMITEATLKRFLDTRFARQDFAELERMADRLAKAGASATGVVQVVTSLIETSVRHRASDIHIEPYETFLRVRFRIDGELYTVLTLEKHMHAPLVSRIKVLANMDISERRKPQDGQIRAKVDGMSSDMRVSTLPTVYGEKCVLRLLRKEANLADIGRLGFQRDQLDTVRKVIELPQGLVLVTGPTGSGKTTTLHAMLNVINESDINIVTIEDPVETAIPGINHVAINVRGGVTFASALKSILRQDPDVVFVGEMRDKEVSAIAVKAALTGHLVLSTLHTNGVIETFARLIDMGIDPYLLANSVELILAQRLLRRICSSCSAPAVIAPEDVVEFELTPQQLETAAYRQGTGCNSCLNTGHRGRVAVYESMAPTPEVRTVLRQGADEQKIAEIAQRMGFQTMRDAAVRRALAGETTFAEVRRVCGNDAR